MVRRGTRQSLPTILELNGGLRCLFRRGRFSMVSGLSETTSMPSATSASSPPLLSYATPMLPADYVPEAPFESILGSNSLAVARRRPPRSRTFVRARICFLQTRPSATTKPASLLTKTCARTFFRIGHRYPLPVILQTTRFIPQFVFRVSYRLYRVSC